MAAVANATGLAPAPDGTRVPAVRRRRPAARAAAARRRRPPASRGAGRGDLQRRARRAAGVPRPALGRVRDVPRGRRGRRGLRAPLLQGVRILDRSVGPLHARCTSRTTRSASSSASASRPRDCGASRRGRRSAWRGDVVATAKRDLAAGETLDGEGGYTVYGKLAAGRRRRCALGGLPLGLAHGVTLDARRRGERAGALGGRRATTRTTTRSGSGARWKRSSALQPESSRTPTSKRTARRAARLCRALERREQRAHRHEQPAERAVAAQRTWRGLRSMRSAFAASAGVARSSRRGRRRSASRRTRVLRARCGRAGSMNCGSTASMNTMPFGIRSRSRGSRARRAAAGAAQPGAAASRRPACAGARHCCTRARRGRPRRAT